MAHGRKRPLLVAKDLSQMTCMENEVRKQRVERAGFLTKAKTVETLMLEWVFFGLLEISMRSNKFARISAASIPWMTGFVWHFAVICMLSLFASKIPFEAFSGVLIFFAPSHGHFYINFLVKPWFVEVFL